jgi:hypothetical protein
MSHYGICLHFSCWHSKIDAYAGGFLVRFEVDKTLQDSSALCY